MMSNFLRTVLLYTVSLAVMSLGFVQAASGEIIGTQQMLDEQTRSASINRVQSVIAQDAVATQLAEYGVDADVIAERMQGMTNVELLQLEQSVDQQIAGEGAVGVIGAVFLVLLILELVGVTDIFKAI
jgi:hypothetical protein